ncbi:hypothetical protein SEA_JACOREN57_37 [Mycobacterium phage JacoRen57]|nr:hypothetical protein SEA_JACOREN57_37 [Mycobacterium phage JacoRen57]
MAIKTKTAAASNGKATAAIIDFSNVKERGNFNPKHIEPGDYAATITKVEQTEAKGDGEPMWVFTITLDDVPRASYPHYCKLVDNQYWKIKALFQAAGINVGQRKVKVDPNRLIGKEIAVGMEDDEYEGRLKSVIVDVFSRDDLHDAGADTAPEDDDLEDDEEEETPPPAKSRKKKPAPEPEEDEEDEEDEEEEPEPAPKKKTPTRKKKPVVEEEDDEDEDELEIDEL